MSAPPPDRRGALMRWWDGIEQTLVGVLGALTLIVGAVQVIGRYLDPEHAISWAE